VDRRIESKFHRPTTIVELLEYSLTKK